MTEPVRPQKRLYTIKNCAVYLDCGIHGVRDLIWRGELPVVKRNGGRKIFIDVRDLDAWIEKSKFRMEGERTRI